MIYICHLYIFNELSLMSLFSNIQECDQKLPMVTFSYMVCPNDLSYSSTHMKFEQNHHSTYCISANMSSLIFNKKTSD